MKTHWRKNKDPKFISGEDLKHNLHGLQDGMVVKLANVNDATSFDQETRQKSAVTELKFIDANNNPLPKGVIVGSKWMADFFQKDLKVGSPYVEDWIEAGHWFVMYAKPDRRFGHVVRFKKYIPTYNTSDYIAKLDGVDSLEVLNATFKSFPDQIRKNQQVIDYAAEIKKQLKEKSNENS